MKKSIRKIVNRLRPLVGHEIIRIKPTCDGDFSYTDKKLILLGFTPKGELIIQNEKNKGSKYYERTLPLEFTDWFWISYKRALKSGSSPLNKWCGKKIKRTTPVFMPWGEMKIYMDRNVLIHASKHHVILSGWLGERILNCCFAKPEDWALDE